MKPSEFNDFFFQTLLQYLHLLQENLVLLFKSYIPEAAGAKDYYFNSITDLRQMYILTNISSNTTATNIQNLKSSFQYIHELYTNVNESGEPTNDQLVNDMNTFKANLVRKMV